MVNLFINSLPNNEHSWIDILSALLVPAIALLGAYIAYQQYRINKARLRNETYERRLSVYKCVQRYLSEILRDGETTYERAAQFSTEASEASFLFDDSVQNKIDEIYQKSIAMVANQRKMYPPDGSPGLPVGAERSKVSEENTELLKWHVEQLTETRKFFAKKLGLKIK